MDVKAIAKLANIGIEEKELARLEQNFEEIRKYFDELSTVPTESTQKDQASNTISAHRQDIAKNSGLSLEFSPYFEQGYIKVPKVIE